MSFILSGSSLPTFADCQGRWAYNNVKGIKEQHARKEPGAGAQGVGALHGTLAHKALANMLKHKRDYGFEQDWRIQAALAAEEYQQKCAQGVKFDGTTGNITGGLIQLERAIRESAFSIVPKLRALHVEEPTGLTLAGDEWLKVVCHIDTDDDMFNVYDHKFSSKEFNYLAQAGIYLLTYKNTYGVTPKDFFINWIQRVGESSLQPDLRVVPYDREAAIDSARKQVLLVASALKDYDSRRTEHKKLWAFNFNPNSKLCTEKTCGAWGTTACNQWMDKSKEKAA